MIPLYRAAFIHCLKTKDYGYARGDLWIRMKWAGVNPADLQIDDELMELDLARMKDGTIVYGPF